MGTERPVTYVMRAEELLRESHEARARIRELRRATLALRAELREVRAELVETTARAIALVIRG